MNWRAVVAMLCLWLAVHPALAGSCPVPDVFSIPPDQLPATRSAVAKGTLNVLAFGGSTPIGAAAHGAAYTYPAQLEQHLRARLPGVSVNVKVLADPHGPGSELVAQLTEYLAKQRPALVIWGPGGIAAARGEDMDSFLEYLNDIVTKIQAGHADLILMTLQYAPSVAMVLNLPPYRDAVVQQAEEAGAAVFDRYALMQYWSEQGFLDFDATGRKERVAVARKLYDCMAEILANGIADAVH